MKRHLLIDANNLLYRAHFASGLVDPKGNRVSGVFNSMRMINNLIMKFKPDTVTVAWDLGKSASRLAIYPDYKATREANRKEDDTVAISNSKDILQKIFKSLPVRQMQVYGVEADDIIGWLATKKLKGEKIIVSNDTDFIQLVKDDTKLYMPKAKRIGSKKGEKAEPRFLNARNVDAFCGFPVKHYVLWKSLVGDKSDNIVGIHGIGPVKATAIIKNGLTGKSKLPVKKEEMDILNLNKYLISIGAVLQDHELTSIREVYKIAKKESKEIKLSVVRKIYRKLDFQSLLYNMDEFEIRFIKLARKAKNGNKEKETNIRIKRKESKVKEEIIKRKRSKKEKEEGVFKRKFRDIKEKKEKKESKLDKKLRQAKKTKLIKR